MSWFTSDVIKQPAAGLPSSFALFSILVFANLGGPRLARLRANVMIVLVGLVALIAGAVTGASVWVAVPATFVAIFAIAYSAVLRGYFASSTNAVIVPWVLGATSGTGVTNLPAECVGGSSEVRWRVRPHRCCGLPRARSTEGQTRRRLRCQRIDGRRTLDR